MEISGVCGLRGLLMAAFSGGWREREKAREESWGPPREGDHEDGDQQDGEEQGSAERFRDRPPPR